MQPVTDKQIAAYEFLTDFYFNEGYFPSIDEIADHLGVQKKAAYDRILALEAKGFIKRVRKNVKSIARAYIITRKDIHEGGGDNE